MSVSDVDFATELFEIDLDHLLGDGAVKLAVVDVNFDFGLLVRPAKLLDLLDLLFCFLLALAAGSRLLHGRRLDEHGVTAVDFAIALKVLGTLRGEVLGRVRVVVRALSLAGNAV